MNIKNIHNQWGAIVEFNNPLDFFNQADINWRKLLYEKKLIVFKKMNFSKEDYIRFSQQFGKPWSNKEYEYSLEKVETIHINGEDYSISPISNLISKKLGLHMMPWHSDIPIRAENPFPIRSLWMVSNPDPESGLTSWLNVEDGITTLPDNLSQQLDKIKIIHQSWYNKKVEPLPYSFVKTHPVTGKQSLRLNFFCDGSKDRNDAWIKDVMIGDDILDPGIILKPYYRELTSHADLLYTHKWDNFDIVIYDNWSFVHRRSELKFDPTLERKFYRTNINHITDTEWELYFANNI